MDAGEATGTSLKSKEQLDSKAAALARAANPVAERWKLNGAQTQERRIRHRLCQAQRRASRAGEAPRARAGSHFFGSRL
jgi:hypothetical protein